MHCEADDLVQNFEVLIEPTVNFKEKYPLMLANSLVDINSTPTVKVRVLNPFQKSVHLRQDTIIGSAEEISPDCILQTVLKCENLDDGENFNTDMSFSREVRGRSDSADYTDLHVPPHLEELF